MTFPMDVDGQVAFLVRVIPGFSFAPEIQGPCRFSVRDVIERIQQETGASEHLAIGKFFIEVMRRDAAYGIGWRPAVGVPGPVLVLWRDVVYECSADGILERGVPVGPTAKDIRRMLRAHGLSLPRILGATPAEQRRARKAILRHWLAS